MNPKICSPHGLFGNPAQAHLSHPFLQKWALGLGLGLSASMIQAQGSDLEASDLADSKKPAVSYLLPKAIEKPSVITFNEALNRALQMDADLLIAKEHFLQKESQKYQKNAALLPSLRAYGQYTRNVPEVSSLGSDSEKNASLGQLYEKVASLFDKTTDADGAASAKLLREQAKEAQRRPSTSTLIKPKDLFEGQLVLSVPLFKGPEIAEAMQASKAFNAEEMRYGQQKAETLYQVAKLFYKALYKSNLEKLRTTQTDRIKKDEAYFSGRFRGGLLPSSDYLQAQYDLAQAIDEESKASLEARSAIAELGIILGMKEEFEVSPAETKHFPFEEMTEEALVELAQKNRPDLQIQKMNMDRMELRNLQSWFQFLPSFSFVAQADYTSNTSDNVRDNPTYAFMFQLSFSLFEGGAHLAKLRETDSQVREQTIRLRKLEQEIPLEVRSNQAKLLHLRRTIPTAQLRVEYTASAHTRGMNQLKSGSISFRDFSKLTQERMDAEVDYEQAVMDLEQEKLAFANSLGMLTPVLLEVPAEQP